MNNERLLDAFNRLGDEPETVQQFRKLVVGLAMSGKLVALDEVEIDAANLLKQVQAKTRTLIQQGVPRKQKSLPALSHGDLPQGFNNPANFVRLGSIARIEKGLTGIMKAYPGPYPLVVTAKDRASCDHFDFDGAAAIIPLVSSAGHGKASLQRLHYQEGKFALGSILAAIFPHSPEHITARFLFEYLTAFKEELLVSQMIGTANVSLSVGKVSDVPVPLVSPSIQRKVDELMGLCDRLEAARESREGVRDRLAAASLARLNAPHTEMFQADARFVLDALPALTTRPDQIKYLRQTILNLAVRGKLVPQDPNDEPAPELLKRIAKEKARLLSEKNSKAKMSIPRDSQIDDFALPATWTWCQLDEISWKVTDGDHLTPKREVKGRYLLSARNVLNGRIDVSDVDFVGDTEFERMRGRCDPNKFDLLISCSGSVGRVAIVDQDDTYVMVRSAALVKPVFASEIGAYLAKALISDCLQTQMGIRSKAAAQPNLFIGPIRQLMIPLPPLAEQHRIVAKVDALMVLCDRLEASLTATAATRRRLLDALLAEALAPAADRQQEAAE